MNDNELKKLKKNYFEFREEIKKCVLERDINYFLEDLNDLFKACDIMTINNSQTSKADTFISCFDNLSDLRKYSYLDNCAKEHSNWIHEFLTVDADNRIELSKLKAKWIILDETKSLIKRLKDNFVFDEAFVKGLYSKDIISKASRDHLLQMKDENSELALFDLFNTISLRDSSWFCNLLYLIAKQNSYLIVVLCDDLEPIRNLTNAEMIERCTDYANHFIEKHVQQYLNDIPNSYTETIDSTSGVFTDDSDVSDLEEPESSDDELCKKYNVSERKEPILETNTSSVLKLHSFQVELSEKALSGENVIIYAPTGAGKTIVAAHIANEHLSKHPEGKVAFLVHRRVLVTQQFRVFDKYKSPSTNVATIRGTSAKVITPLKSQIESNQIFIMTSDILRNALIFDDENQIKSITQFSLIFFDECHNCMASHPYTKIMNEYFKEKRSNPNQALPQIVGLTASPRSNNKVENKGMKNALFELCGNLDCCHIAMVTKNKEDLEALLSQPETSDCLTKKRDKDKFETVLLKLIELCENKLIKMQNENYFRVNRIPSAPAEKYSQKYINFVGNLDRLNTLTIDECDGKEKAHCIFRYLNALYRAVIVNQLFNQEFAQKKLKNRLKREHRYTTCCYDEEFYNYYKDNILNKEYEQSDNPAIMEILWLVKDQLTKNDDSRILIFVRERDFTEYLADILKNKLHITAEPIIGCSAKPDLDSMTCNNIDDIIERFGNGKTKVLVSTTVTEEGTNIPLCNMVISYGLVTNETALIQRTGRLRAIGSKYVLVLPLMLHWLQQKEETNKWRKGVMKQIITDLRSYDSDKIKESNKIHQNKYFPGEIKVKVEIPPENLWIFKCRICQAHVCTSADLRILEKAHRVCIKPELIKKCKVEEEENQTFGSSGFYEKAGDIFCWQCGKQKIGTYIKYKKVDYFQIKLDRCSATNARNQIRNFKKWTDFSNTCALPEFTATDHDTYCNSLADLP